MPNGLINKVQLKICSICQDQFLAEPIKFQGRWSHSSFCSDCDQMLDVLVETGEWNGQ